MLKGQEPKKANINIFFEILNNRFYALAPVNLFFPNPEWFEWPALLKGIDLVMCKTHDCQRIFKLWTDKTVFTSFTSEDRNTGQRADEIVYLHTAGQSSAKGTDVIFKAWKPDYPQLILTKLRDFGALEKPKANVHTCFDRVPIEILTEMQNKSTFHVCPSEYEGFGHYIWEAKSCGGIVITTDKPPMNEMVTEGVDGFLVPAVRSRRFHFGRLHMIEVAPLREVIEKTMLLTTKEIADMRLKSRWVWEDNDKQFKAKFLQIIKSYGA
jgi:glycosyltransferase involved in cell wall biosynthesis